MVFENGFNKSQSKGFKFGLKKGGKTVEECWGGNRTCHPVMSIKNKAETEKKFGVRTKARRG